MMKSDELRDVHQIEDLDTLRVMADPLRVHIVEILISEPLPVKQIAQRLGLSPSKLYYHVNQLEEHGLIQVVDTRMVSGIVEKQYRAVSKQYRVKHELLSTATEEGRRGVNTAITAAIDSTKDDILRSLEARQFETEHGAPPHPRKALVVRHHKRLSESDADEFRRRLNALADEFDEAPESDPEGQSFGLLIAYYPSFYFPEDESENES